MKKFQNKYRIPSARATWWNYANEGAYFVTICTKNREHYFGEIVETRFIASQIGTVINTICIELENQFFYAELGEFVIMPNHIHMVIVISSSVETPLNIETPLMASLQTNNNEIPIGGFAGNKNPMLNNNLSRIVRWFKGRCTFEIRKIHADFEWQSRFHDHIIRNDIEYQTICEYIENNPLNWKQDKFYKNE